MCVRGMSTSRRRGGARSKRTKKKKDQDDTVKWTRKEVRQGFRRMNVSGAASFSAASGANDNVSTGKKLSRFFRGGLTRGDGRRARAFLDAERMMAETGAGDDGSPEEERRDVDDEDEEDGMEGKEEERRSRSYSKPKSAAVPPPSQSAAAKAKSSGSIRTDERSPGGGSRRPIRTAAHCRRGGQPRF